MRYVFPGSGFVGVGSTFLSRDSVSERDCERPWMLDEVRFCGGKNGLDDGLPPPRGLLVAAQLVEPV
jgi:hypothetical protein